MGLVGDVCRLVLGGLVALEGLVIMLTGALWMAGSAPFLWLPVIAILAKAGFMAGALMLAFGIATIVVGVMAALGSRTAVTLVGIGVVLGLIAGLIRVLLLGIPPANLLWYAILVLLLLGSAL